MLTLLMVIAFCLLMTLIVVIFGIFLTLSPILLIIGFIVLLDYAVFKLLKKVFEKKG